ncbi:MAG: glycosyltransferase [Muribaculaceae bacterium]|nr:glycosyltransferase [Muribaculaceae bacterium]
MKVGISILNYNDAESTISILNSIKDYSEIDRIVVIDNNSSDDSYSKLLSLKDNIEFHLIKAECNGGYSYGNNLGLRYLVEVESVDIAIIANPDIIIEPTVIGYIKDFFLTQPDSGLVSPVMLDRNSNKTRMWLKSPSYLNSILDCSVIGRQLNKIIRKVEVNINSPVQRVDILPGSFLAFRAQALKDINYLDENVFLYYEENIIGERLKDKGYATYLLTKCSYVHNHSVTIKKNLSILNAFKCNLKSKMYFEKEYHQINDIQELFLKFCMKYAVVEMNLILKIKSLLKR